MRAVVRGSRLLWLLLVVWRRIVAVPPVRLERPDDGAAIALAAGSGLVRAIDRLFRAWASAWPTSAMGRRLRSVASLPAAERLRTLGWMLAAAAGTRLLLAGVPAHAVALALELGWVLTGVVGIVLIACPDAVIAAAATSAAVGVWRRRQ